MSFGKLQANGITCKLLNWTKVSLTGKRHQVVINGFQSDESNIISGIPQGLVLGPLLFLIYVTMVFQELFLHHHYCLLMTLKCFYQILNGG